MKENLDDQINLDIRVEEVFEQTRKPPSIGAFFLVEGAWLVDIVDSEDYIDTWDDWAILDRKSQDQTERENMSKDIDYFT